MNNSKWNPKWMIMYMDLADRIAKESYAERLKVGAIFVSSEGIMSIGINGLPAGGSNECEVLIDNELQTKPEVSHAEENLFAKLMREGLSTKGGTIFITHSPCINCAKMVVGAGIAYLYYKENYRSMDGIDWLQQNGVYCSQYKGESK